MSQARNRHVKQKGLCLAQIWSSLYKLGLVAPQKGNNHDCPFLERITSGPTANMTWIRRFLWAVLPIAALCVFGCDLHILCASHCVCVCVLFSLQVCQSGCIPWSVWPENPQSLWSSEWQTEAASPRSPSPEFASLWRAPPLNNKWANNKASLWGSRSERESLKTGGNYCLFVKRKTDENIFDWCLCCCE